MSKARCTRSRARPLRDQFCRANAAAAAAAARSRRPLHNRGNSDKNFLLFLSAIEIGSSYRRAEKFSKRYDLLFDEQGKKTHVSRASRITSPFDEHRLLRNVV